MDCSIIRSVVYGTVLLGVAAVVPTGALDCGTPANPSLTMERKQGNEVVGFFTVNPAVASQWVPPPFELLLDARGNASGALVVLDTADYNFVSTPNSPPLEQGENLAGPLVHFWFMLKGPAEVLPIPGAQVTNPTQYAYDVADMVTNRTVHRLWRRQGKNAILVRSITLSDQGNTQTGAITFMNGSKITYNAYTPTQSPPPLLLGSNVWYWHVADDEEPNAGMATTRIQSIAALFGAPGSTQVTIHAEPGTGFSDYYGQSDVITYRGVFFRPNNIASNSSRGDLAWTTYPPVLVKAPPDLP